ncbi:MAG TPA: peptidylprolyl isomerase [Eggerthellaceae bacterium]|nr:peptidylprolyl isomerase [Eggerthellaceae bacterium]
MKTRTFVIVMALALAVAACGFVLAGCGQAASSQSAAASSSANASASGASAGNGAGATGGSGIAATGTGAGSGVTSEATGPYASGVHHARLTVEGYDPITIELNADAAPVSVANFCALAGEGYYNGLTFYRFVEGFCMQGGTLGNTASGADSSLKPIVGEFSGNGRSNALADDFKRGTVAMARTNAPNSATSTFFVTLDTSSSVSASLNGQYAAFGTIDEAGMAIVDAIVADHLPAVTDTRMGVISDESKQAKIASLEIVD